MTITARDNLAPVWWYPASEEDEEVRTEFELTPFNQVDYFHFMSQGETKLVTGVGVGFVPNKHGVQFMLDRCVTNWRNFLDADGGEIEFKPKNKQMIPVEVIKEIFSEVVRRSSISAELKKSS